MAHILIHAQSMDIKHQQSQYSKCKERSKEMPAEPILFPRLQI